MITAEFFTLINKKSFILIITHTLGGGTERYVQELKVAANRENYGAIIFRQYLDKILLEVWYTEEDSKEFEFSNELEQEYLRTFLALFNIVLVHVHHLIDHKPDISNIITEVKASLVITLHDYYFVCPRVHLTPKSTPEYCGEQGLKACNNCIKNNANFIYGIQDIETWREYWLKLLNKANLIIAPSQDTKNRFHKYYPHLNIMVKYHPEIFADLDKPAIDKVENSPIKVGLLGHLTEIKGMNTFYKCIEDSEERKLEVKFVVFGKTKRENIANKKSYEILGAYQEKTIYELINSNNIDAFLFLSQAPETYSYVLTIPMLLKIPIIATNLGAFNERLENYPLGKIIDWQMKATKINDTILEHIEYCRNVKKDFSVPVTTTFSKLEDYYGIKVPDNKIVKSNFSEVELLLEKINQANQYYFANPITSDGMKVYAKKLRTEKKYLLGLYWRIRYLWKKYISKDSNQNI